MYDLFCTQQPYYFMLFTQESVCCYFCYFVDFKISIHFISDNLFCVHIKRYKTSLWIQKQQSFLERLLLLWQFYYWSKKRVHIYTVIFWCGIIHSIFDEDMTWIRWLHKCIFDGTWEKCVILATSINIYNQVQNQISNQIHGNVYTTNAHQTNWRKSKSK